MSKQYYNYSKPTSFVNEGKKDQIAYENSGKNT